MKGIIVSIRSNDNIVKSRNALISMLEELISKKTAQEKKRILSDEYGMIMNEELERKVNTMCNWLQAIKENATNKERIESIRRMLKADISKEKIISMGYKESEIAEAIGIETVAALA